jgi:hypothetical protein
MSPCTKFHELDGLMTQPISQYQMLEGELSQLRTEATHVHYLKNIKQQQQMAGAVAMVQAAAGQAGAIHSVQAANDEGDPVEGFTMQVAGKTVRGSFWKTTFKDGDHVQIVGQDRNGVFEAIAVIKPDERMIWMQPHCERGTQAKKKHLLKCSGWFVLFGYFCAFLLSIFSDMPTWANFLIFSLTIPVILLVTVGMSWRDFMTFAREMDDVGVALGLPEPENIDLFKSTKLAQESGKPDVPIGVYYY